MPVPTVTVYVIRDSQGVVTGTGGSPADCQVVLDFQDNLSIYRPPYTITAEEWPL